MRRTLLLQLVANNISRFPDDEADEEVMAQCTRILAQVCLSSRSVSRAALELGAFNKVVLQLAIVLEELNGGEQTLAADVLAT